MLHIKMCPRQGIQDSFLSISMFVDKIATSVEKIHPLLTSITDQKGESTKLSIHASVVRVERQRYPSFHRYSNHFQGCYASLASFFLRDRPSCQGKGWVDQIIGLKL